MQENLTENMAARVKNTADAGRNVLIPQTAGEENFGARLYQSSCIAGMPADHGRPAAGKC